MELGDATRMGPRLQREVERQLLEDLTPYGIATPGIQIDWSDSCQEGHCTTCLDGNLEDLSGLVVRDRHGAAVADGWMDFIHGGGDRPLVVFWLFLAVGSGDARREVKTEPLIPDHVWARLTEDAKSLCAWKAGYDSRWSRDPKVIAWKHRHAR